MTDDAEQVHLLVNDIRRAQGLVTLRRNVLLDRAAMNHAIDMARYRYHAHTDREGRDAKVRIERTGYLDDHRGYAVAENVAMGYIGPREVVSAWMESPGHRANILGEPFIESGVGVAIAENGWRYWAQVFAVRYGP